MDPVNVAVVGCGRFGGVHAATYARFEHSRLVVVCDLDESRAKAMAQKFDCAYTCRIEQIAGDEQVQAVSVTTPDFAHRKACVLLAEAGKHVLVEKPLATSVEDAKAIVAAVDAAGVIGCVDFHNRYHPGLRAVKQKLDDGDFGSLRMLFGRLSDRIEVATEWFSWAGRSGPEWFLGSHLVDLACWLMDAEPIRVFADGSRGVLASRGIDCFDCMQIHLSFPQAMATLETSWILPDSWPSVADFSVSVQTTTSRADINGSYQGVCESSPGSYSWPFLQGLTPIGEDDFGYFSMPIRDFVRTVQRGGSAPKSMQQGLMNVRVIEAAIRSIDERSVIEMLTE
jgi:predicted dehydrogenase